jgi:hypothetical protein
MHTQVHLSLPEQLDLASFGAAVSECLASAGRARPIHVSGLGVFLAYPEHLEGEPRWQLKLQPRGLVREALSPELDDPDSRDEDEEDFAKWLLEHSNRSRAWVQDELEVIIWDIHDSIQELKERGGTLTIPGLCALHVEVLDRPALRMEPLPELLVKLNAG